MRKRSQSAGRRPSIGQTNRSVPALRAGLPSCSSPLIVGNTDHARVRPHRALHTRLIQRHMRFEGAANQCVWNWAVCMHETSWLSVQYSGNVL